MAELTHDFTMTLAGDRQSLQLDFPSTLTVRADELENVMRQLAVMRASMLPAVQDEDLNERSVWSVVPASRWHVTPDPDVPTQVRLFLLHRGFGWVWIPLGRPAIAALTATIQKVLQHLPTLQ